MSGETENQVSGWTVDTLREHMQRQIVDMRSLLDERYATQTKALDAAFAAADKAVQTALLSAEKAVVKAETATEKRFEGVNEFRQTVTDIAANNVTRAEFAAVQLRNDERIQILTDLSNREGGSREGVRLSNAALVGFAGLAVAIIVAVVVVATALT